MLNKISDKLQSKKNSRGFTYGPRISETGCLIENYKYILSVNSLIKETRRTLLNYGE